MLMSDKALEDRASLRRECVLLSTGFFVVFLFCFVAVYYSTLVTPKVIIACGLWNFRSMMITFFLNIIMLIIENYLSQELTLRH